MKEVDGLQQESTQVSAALSAAKQEYDCLKQKFDKIENEKFPLEERLNQLQKSVRSNQNLYNQWDQLSQNISQLNQKSIEYCKEFPQNIKHIGM